MDIVPFMALSCTSGSWGFPGMFLRCAERLFFTRPVAPTMTGMISISSRSQVSRRSCLRSWYLFCFSLSTRLRPKSFGTETSMIFAHFSVRCHTTIRRLRVLASDGTRDLHLRPHLCCFWTDWDKQYTKMSALERTFEWRRVIDPRTLVPSVIFSYAVTYDLRDLWLTQVIRDVIGDDPEVRGRKIVFHSKVLTKTDILVYYMSQSVQKQQRCGLKCRSRVRLTPKLATLLMW